MFRDAKGHPNDPFYPDHHAFESPPYKPLYDIWCQIMVRCLIVSRRTYDLENLMRVDHPELLDINGSLISFYGTVRGNVAYPKQYESIPVSYTVLRVKNDRVVWSTRLPLKTHYLYSVTASESLSRGRSNGILILRSIDNSSNQNGKKVVRFSCTPLMIGNGVLKIEKS
jgi:hypothetical protein